MICKSCGCMTGNDDELCDDCLEKRRNIYDDMNAQLPKAPINEELHTVEQQSKNHIYVADTQTKRDLNEIRDILRKILNVAYFFLGITLLDIVITIFVFVIPSLK